MDRAASGRGAGGVVSRLAGVFVLAVCFVACATSSGATSTGAVNVQAQSPCDPFKDTEMCGFANGSAAALSCDASSHLWTAKSVCAPGAKCSTSVDFSGHSVPSCSAVATGGGADASSSPDIKSFDCATDGQSRCVDGTHLQVCVSGIWANAGCPSGMTCVTSSGGQSTCKAPSTPGQPCDPSKVLEGCGTVSGQAVRMTCDAASKVWVVLQVCPAGSSCSVSGLQSSCGK